MSVVDLTGRPVVGDVPDNKNCLNLLKLLVAEIESGERIVEDFYLITDCNCGKETRSFDNGLSLMQAITMLEREKFRLLCMSEGVNL